MEQERMDEVLVVDRVVVQVGNPRETEMEQVKMEEGVFKALMLLSACVAAGIVVLFLGSIFLRGYPDLDLEVIKYVWPGNSPYP